MVLQSLFSTLIETAPLGSLDLCARLEKACWAIAEGDAAGQAWSEREGYDGYTSYASLNDLPQRFPEFAELQALLDPAAADFARALHWDLGGRALHLDALWINILPEGGAHSGHIHPGSVISGTYYVSVPDGAGALKLEDPRLALMMASPMPQAHAPEALRRFVYLLPQPGHIFLWESWLRHEVMVNRAEIERISISFNYAWR